MDENKKLNILKDRKLDRQEKNKSEGLKKGKGRRTGDLPGPVVRLRLGKGDRV